jgi:hypothetical protein
MNTYGSDCEFKTYMIGLLFTCADLTYAGYFDHLLLCYGHVGFSNTCKAEWGPEHIGSVARVDLYQQCSSDPRELRSFQ